MPMFDNRWSQSITVSKQSMSMVDDRSPSLCSIIDNINLRFIIITSNKKHFMKNVKECRDVIVKKVLEQGWDTRTTHYTHVGPMTPYIVVINYMTCIACLCKKQPDLL